MNRCGIALGIALASVFELEGLCFAHATSPELLLDPSPRDGSAMTLEVVVVESTPALLPPPVSGNDRSDAGEADDHARDRMCHISRHPRDGIQPERHPCPPLVAGTPRTLKGQG
jgi:hypothetical protein